MLPIEMFFELKRNWMTKQTINLNCWKQMIFFFLRWQRCEFFYPPSPQEKIKL